MIRQIHLAWMIGLTLLLGGVARAADEAADFPPGLFTDGGHYDLKDLRGKVVVLFFFEHECPRCKGLVPERNNLMRSLHGKPVLFLAIDPGHTITDANAYAMETKLAMPVFADPLRVMEARWHQRISLNNIYQFRVIGPDGSVAAFREDDINRVLEGVQWKYKKEDYNAKLAPALQSFEWNQYNRGMKLLKPLLKDHSKDVAQSAQNLLEAVKAEGKQWKEDADKAMDEKPVEAFDLYSRVVEVFPGDELAKSAEAPLKQLRSQKVVKDELAARQMYNQLSAAMSKAQPQQKNAVLQFCAAIAKKYPDAPTGQRALALGKELLDINSVSARAD